MSTLNSSPARKVRVFEQVHVIEDDGSESRVFVREIDPTPFVFVSGGLTFSEPVTRVIRERRGGERVA